MIQPARGTKAALSTPLALRSGMTDSRKTPLTGETQPNYSRLAA